MTPPEATLADQQGQAGATPSAVSCGVPEISTLKQRADFLKANHGRRQGTPAFLLQARQRHEDEAPPASLIRIGFTCSKRVGNAVVRNRAKRRLREIARVVLPLEGTPGWDYVLIGRANITGSRPLDQMRRDLIGALAKIHAQRPKL
ncbi:MAG: ribonuclease P protein component [Alphaproteobacteria bacterium]|nr:ribonuclease P protein component [Alphaproteobacteria bacterium]